MTAVGRTVWARRALITAWLALLVLGSLNHTILPRLGVATMDLWLPHLRYGHVMFNRMPRTVLVHEVRMPDGRVEHLSELLPVSSLTYGRARVEANLLLRPELLVRLCMQAAPAQGRVTLLTTTYTVDHAGAHARERQAMTCDQEGPRMVLEPSP